MSLIFSGYHGNSGLRLVGFT
ncbi:hypothetical protein RDI58_006255 [Solanum bulbocastanum]|uniref:Uncharacterized protein n=1 Tax=Solanum bulbocastanum TaxID=147425 RepID=A0AAN8YND0_SOLBU